MNSPLRIANLIKRAGWIALIPCLIVTLGCGAGEPRTSTVVGRVTLDDQPLNAGSILLLSETGDSGGGELNADGTYSLVCKPGSYLAAVMPLAVEVGEDGAPLNPAQSANAMKIPPQYQDVGSSKLTVDVSAGDNTFDVQLVSKPAR